MDPELALALRMSLEEDRARQERERKAQEEAEGKTKLEGVPEEQEGGEDKPLLDGNGEPAGSAAGSAGTEVKRWEDANKQETDRKISILPKVDSSGYPPLKAEAGFAYLSSQA